MAKSDAGGKSEGKTGKTRTSPPTATANERKQGGRQGSSGSPKVGKRETDTERKGDGLH
ncbi:MAG TPA: hypothetical protein VGV59_02270 [Pyrinomonadaceae bacterium]|nr:hypothetical protein [Pyrinomonadaceae bacterium]